MVWRKGARLRIFFFGDGKKKEVSIRKSLISGPIKIPGKKEHGAFHSSTAGRTEMPQYSQSIRAPPPTLDTSELGSVNGMYGWDAAGWADDEEREERERYHCVKSCRRK